MGKTILQFNLTTLFFLISILPYKLKAQSPSSWLNIEMNTNFTKPKGNVNDNHFDMGIGFGIILQKGWTTDKGHSFSGGIIYNRLVFKEVIPNLLFGSDVVNGTRSKYNRTLRFNEVGGTGLYAKEITLGKSKILPTTGIGFSRIFGEVDYERVEGNGPESLKQNDIEVPDYSFNFYFGVGWMKSTSKSGSLGIRPIFTYRTGQAKSSDLLASSTFNTNSISLEFIFRQNLK